MKIKFLFKCYDADVKDAGGTDVIVKAIKEVGDTNQKSIEKLKGELAADQEAKIKLAIKEAVEPLQGEVSSLKVKNEQLEKEREEEKQKAATKGIGAGMQVKSFSQEVTEKIGGEKWQAAYKHYKDNDKRKGFAIDLDTKAVGNMSASSNLTGSYFSAQQVAGITVKPYESVHLRDVLPVGQTDRDTIRYVVDNGGEGGPAMVAAGGTKPQIDRDIEIKDSAVKKIATYFRLPEEMVEDIPYLQSFLTQIGVEEVMAVEDAQILTGDGTGNNLNGIYTGATTFSQAASGVAVVTAPQEYDVVRAAQVQLQVAKYQPTLAILNPVDWYNMTSRKDTTNNYILQGGGNGLVPQLSGMRVLIQNQIAAGTFLVGDPRTTAIFDRMGTTVRVFEQDQDNAIKNLITVVIEKRLALVNYRPGAWVKGSLATGVTDLTS